MSIIITGGSGFLGTALAERLAATESTIYDLSRHPKKGVTIPLTGDITKTNLGLTDAQVPKDLTAVWHLAAIHDLGPDPKGVIQKTNVDGTRNVIEFCKGYGIRRLLFCSTAYTQGRNPYEKSKIVCEDLVANSGIPSVIFKPSIIMGSENYFFAGHFLQFVLLILRLHRSLETVRRAIEGAIRLPAIRPVFRIPGQPEAPLNLVRVEDVADRMVLPCYKDRFYLTNPYPPRLQQLCDWVSEVIMVDVKITSGPFPAMPLEKALQKYGAAFLPYLQGDPLPSDMGPGGAIDKPFIQNAVKRAILEGGKNVVI